VHEPQKHHGIPPFYTTMVTQAIDKLTIKLRTELSVPCFSKSSKFFIQQGLV